MPLERAGSAQDALELHAGDDIWKLAVAVQVKLRIERLEAGGENHRPNLQRVRLRLLIEIYRARRAELLARPALAFLEINAVSFVQNVLEGHRLGVLHIGRLALAEALVECVVHLPRALLRAYAAGDALFHVHVPGSLPDRRREPSGLPVQRLEIRHREEVDVQMPPPFHQFGRKDAHRTIVGRKCLIQLRHDPADAGRLLHQMHEVARTGQIERSLDPGDSSADDHHRSDRAVSVPARCPFSLLFALLGLHCCHSYV